MIEQMVCKVLGHTWLTKKLVDIKREEALGFQSSRTLRAMSSIINDESVLVDYCKRCKKWDIGLNPNVRKARQVNQK